MKRSRVPSWIQAVTFLRRQETWGAVLANAQAG